MKKTKITLLSILLGVSLLASCGSPDTDGAVTGGDGTDTSAVSTETTAETERELTPAERFQEAHDASYFAKDRDVEMNISQTYSSDGGETVSSYSVEVRDKHLSEGLHSLKQINSSGANTVVTSHSYGNGRAYYSSADTNVTGECTYEEYEKLFLDHSSHSDDYTVKEGYESFTAEQDEDGYWTVKCTEPNDKTLKSYLEQFAIPEREVTEVVEFDSTDEARISPEGFFESESYTFSATLKTADGNTLVITSTGTSNFLSLNDPEGVELILPSPSAYEEVGSFRGYMLANKHYHDPTYSAAKSSIDCTVTTPAASFELEEQVSYTGKLEAGYTYSGELTLDRTLQGEEYSYTLTYDGSEFTTASATAEQKTAASILEAYDAFISYIGMVPSYADIYESYSVESAEGGDRVFAKLSDGGVSELTELYLGHLSNEDFSSLRNAEKEITVAQAEMEFDSEDELTAVTYDLQVSYKDATGTILSINVKVQVTELIRFE